MTAIEVWNKVYSPESGEDIFEYIERAMREYARLKCLEAIENTKDKCMDIVMEWCDYGTPSVKGAVTLIENIPNQDVMPEL